MNRNDLNRFKKWFSDYTETFHSSNRASNQASNQEDRKNISLKVEHTFNVCKAMMDIAKEQSLNTTDLLLAETVALFHDLGRFPQYAEYRTFKDSASVNHGALGAKILQEQGVLQNLPVDEQELIIDAVKFHNAFTIPDIANPKTLLFLKLIRDADKLDIWRVLIEYYEKNELTSAITLDLPDQPGYSEKVLSCIYNNKPAFQADLETLNDLKLLALSWIYDLNFQTSFRLLTEKDCINRIAAMLPKTEEIKRVSLHLKEFVSERLKQQP